MLPLIILVIPWMVLAAITGAYRSLKRALLKPDVSGKIVVITGASSGLGKECAKCFATAGAKVVLCSRNENELLKVKDEITKELSQVQDKVENEPAVIRLDLENVEQIADIAHSIVSRYGHVDILINNAGMSYRGTIGDTSLETHQRLMTVNYFGQLELTRGILPSMVKRQTGHIVAVSSVQGKLSIPFRSAYSASKHACQAFFDCLRSEVAESGIKVTTISPGYISTNLSRNALVGDGSKYGARDGIMKCQLFTTSELMWHYHYASTLRRILAVPRSTVFFLDKTTASGMPPSAVAHRILDAVELGDEDVILADFKSTVAIYLRTFVPDLLFRILKARAKSSTKEKAE